MVGGACAVMGGGLGGWRCARVVGGFCIALALVGVGAWRTVDYVEVSAD